MGHEAPPGRVVAVVLAGGSGTRMGSTTNKVYLHVAGRAVLTRALAAVGGHAEVTHVVVVARPEDRDHVADCLAAIGIEPAAVVAGGATRTASEQAALAAVRPLVQSPVADVVLVHDGARPFVTPALVSSLIAAARRCGGAIPGLALDGPVVRREGGVMRVVDERDLRRVQTPQAFLAGPLLDAYAAAEAAAMTDAVDTAEVVARFAAVRAVVVPGDERNLKVTVPGDLVVAERIAAELDRELEPDA